MWSENPLVVFMVMDSTQLPVHLMRIKLHGVSMGELPHMRGRYQTAAESSRLTHQTSHTLSMSREAQETPGVSEWLFQR